MAKKLADFKVGDTVVVQFTAEYHRSNVAGKTVLGVIKKDHTYGDRPYYMIEFLNAPNCFVSIYNKDTEKWRGIVIKYLGDK
ncbi:hypothetical protein D3C78_1411310 [compost metagenome]